MSFFQQHDIIVKRSSFPNTATYDPRQSRRLYTIPEEAETMTITTTTTTTTPSCSRLRDGQQQHCMIDNNNNNNVNSNTNGSICSPNSQVDLLYQVPKEWIYNAQPVDSNGQLIGDESRCQMHMSQRIQHAYRSHQRRSLDNSGHHVAVAARTELHYDSHDNISGLQITCPSGTSEYWPLYG